MTETNNGTEISFDIEIDRENQIVSTTVVYETAATSGSKSGGTSISKYNGLGIKIYEVRVDGTFSYNGSSASTTSANATFTPALLSSWTSSPTASSGKSGTSAYARASGTASNGSSTQSYSVTLYCDKSGNLSS